MLNCLWNWWDEYPERADRFMRNLAYGMKPARWPRLGRRIFVCGFPLFIPMLMLAWAAFFLLYSWIIVTWVFAYGILIALSSVLRFVLWPLMELKKLW